MLYSALMYELSHTIVSVPISGYDARAMGKLYRVEHWHVMTLRDTKANWSELDLDPIDPPLC